MHPTVPAPPAPTTPSPERPTPPGAVSPRTAAAGLVVSAGLLAVSVLTQPDLTGGAAGKLAAIDAAGGRAVLSAVLFATAQLPFVLGVLGLGALVRGRAPRLARAGTALGVAGGFGHAMFGGLTFAYLVMAGESSNRSAYVALVADIESSPVMLVSLVGLAGTVLGMLLLSVALFRAGIGPRWVGPLVWAFLVVEFVGGALSDYASYLSSVLLVVVCLTLARVLLDPSRYDTHNG
jgi:hypothetical protein